jgi:5'-3' exonuclease
MEPVLFIDLSYFVFYRFFALVNWYRLSSSSDDAALDISQVHEDPVFLEKFKRICGDTIAKIHKQKGVRADRVWLASDCSRGAIWRHALFSGYKAKRDTASRKFNSQIFTYMFDDVLPSILAKHPYHLISVDNAEADDIIGVMKTRLRRENPELPVFILTNDKDYIQLHDEYTSIFNLQGKLLAPVVTSAVDLQWKVLTGDSSDNIPSVFPRAQKKRLQAYIDDPALLARHLSEDPHAAQRYERNRALIDMARIPADILEKMDPAWEVVRARVGAGSEST